VHCTPKSGLTKGQHTHGSLGSYALLPGLSGELCNKSATTRRARPARSGPDASTRQRDSPGGSTAPALSSRPVRCPADAPDSPRPQCSRPFKPMPKHHLGGKL
jgi:hypothetical protein